MKLTTRQMAICGILGALYAAITLATAAISYGPIQFRISEALCILPFFAPFTSWGLFIGCIVANIASSVTALDTIIGSLATLIACFITAKIKKPWLAPLPTVLVNGVVIGAMIAYFQTPNAFLEGFLLFGSQVAFGELVVMYVLGLPLLLTLKKHKTLDRLL